MNTNASARGVLVEAFNNHDLKLPKNVKFCLEENRSQCKITLKSETVQGGNMQTDANAFEAWAIALHIALGEPGKIVLDVDGALEETSDKPRGHWGRFLYRALRFSEQYGEWFSLSDRIAPVVDEFKKSLEEKYFTNNLGEGEAGIKTNHGDENIVEAKFAEAGVLRGIIDVGKNEVYRQLPVGLFDVTEDVVKDAADERKPYHYRGEKRVFVGGKAAIDLWTWDDDKFEVIELKTNNPMIGIITEIFFYSNYMYDFLVREKTHFLLNTPKPKKSPKYDRGYSTILDKSGSFKKIRGIMLANQYHPILEDGRILGALNNNGMDRKIEYAVAHYKCDLFLSK